MLEKVYARVPFTYRNHSLEVGEMFELKGARNDEKLVQLRYVIVVDEKYNNTRKCDTCGKEFMSSSYVSHVKRQHKEVEVTNEDYDPLFQGEE